MSYKLIIPSSVEKEINKLPEYIAQNILNHLIELENNPYPRGSKKLINREGWRIRIGSYRVIYDVNTNDKEIYLRKIAHRKDIYH